MVQLLVGGALTAGFRLTNRLLGNTPRESVERQARAAQAKAKGGVIDIEAKVLTLSQTYLLRGCASDKDCVCTASERLHCCQ